MVNGRVDNDPEDHERAERGHEALLDDVPHAAELVLVYLLERDGVYVNECRIYARIPISHRSTQIKMNTIEMIKYAIEWTRVNSQNDGKDALEREESPYDAEHEARYLPYPVDDVEELVLVLPRAVGRERPARHRCHSSQEAAAFAIRFLLAAAAAGVHLSFLDVLS